MSRVSVACFNACFVFILICVSEWKENVSNASCWDSLSCNYESFMLYSEICVLFTAACIVNRFDTTVMILYTYEARWVHALCWQRNGFSFRRARPINNLHIENGIERNLLILHCVREWTGLIHVGLGIRASSSLARTACGFYNLSSHTVQYIIFTFAIAITIVTELGTRHKGLK